MALACAVIRDGILNFQNKGKVGAAFLGHKGRHDETRHPLGTLLYTWSDP